MAGRPLLSFLSPLSPAGACPLVPAASVAAALGLLLGGAVEGRPLSPVAGVVAAVAAPFFPRAAAGLVRVLVLSGAPMADAGAGAVLG